MPDPDPSTTNKPTMRAVVFDGHPYKVHVRTLPKLTIVWQTDAVVRLTAVHPRGRRAGDHRGVLRDADVPGRVQRGDTVSPTVPCPLSEVWKKGLTLRAGPVDSKTAVAPLLELIRGGGEQGEGPGFVFSSVMDIEHAPEAYRRFSKRLETKVLIRFEGGAKTGQEGGGGGGSRL